MLTNAAPYAVPTLTVNFLYHIASAFFAYTQYAKGHANAYAFAFVMSSLLACTGGWCLMFGVSDGKIEKRSVHDSTKDSGFPFSNKKADISKEVKKEDKDEKKGL